MSKKEQYSLKKYVKKSNPLIEALSKTTLFENKLRLLAEMNVQKDENNNTYESRVPSSYIKSLMGVSPTSGKINDMLLAATLNIMNRKLVIRDKTTNAWAAVNLVTKAIYNNSELVVTWNPETVQYIYDVQKDYSWINRELQLSVNSNYSYKLYELLIRNAFLKKNQQATEENTYYVTFLISELRVQLGVVDIEDVGIQSYLIKTANRKEEIDFEEINRLDKKQKYKEYKEFNRNVISKAVKEINESEKSDIYVTTRKVTGPPSGKVVAIEFKIKRIKEKDEVVVNVSDDKVVQEEVQENLTFKLREFIKEPLTEHDMESILKASGYDVEKIKKAYDIAVASKSKIENLTGFLIKALKEDYSMPVEKKNTDRFNNFPQRNYDYDELEKKLLNPSVMK